MDATQLKYCDRKLTEILVNTNNIALILASHIPEKPSYRVMKYLIENGYTVFPINTFHTHKKIQDIKVYSCLEEIPKKIDMINIFQKNADAGKTIYKAINLNIKYIWTQLNIFNFEAAREAEKNNHVIIMNRCTKIEHSRLIKKL
tara:strand:- start:609 stop:1043 length:435 start_codon:yes stop_codon:yes gene_type:complete